MPPKKSQGTAATSSGSTKRQQNLFSFFTVKNKTGANKSSSSTTFAKNTSASTNNSNNGSNKASSPGSLTGGSSELPRSITTNSKAKNIVESSASPVTPNIDKSGNDTTVTSKTAPKASPTTTTATTTNNKNNKTINPQAAKVQINTGIAVFWRDDKKYYACTVKKKDGHRCFLEYEDGESEWLDLRFEKFRFLDDEDFGEDDAMVSSDAEEEETTPQKNKNKTINSSTRKRPRIHDSDDEEFEFDSDSSEDKHDEEFDDAVEEEEEQADDWLVSDDDNDIDDHEDEQPRKKKKVATKTSIKVTQHKPTNDVLTPRTTPKTSRPVSSSDSAVTPTSLNSFSAFSQAQATQENSNITTGAPRKVTPPSSTRTSATSIAMEASNGGINADGTPRALPYVMNAVNPTGSHLHNHLKFLLDPKDSRGRPKGSPNYDPRTLTVDRQVSSSGGRPRSSILIRYSCSRRENSTKCFTWTPTLASMSSAFST